MILEMENLFSFCTTWYLCLLSFRIQFLLNPLFDMFPPFNRSAAIVMLSGQVADGFTTIFAGELVFKHFSLYSKDRFRWLFPSNFTFTLAAASSSMYTENRNVNSWYNKTLSIFEFKYYFQWISVIFLFADHKPNTCF